MSSVPRARVRVPGDPFGVATTADGRWSFVALDSSVGVMANRKPVPPVRVAAPVLVRQVKVPGFPLGARLTHNGRYLVMADDNRAVVVNVTKAERGTKGAVVGTLSSKNGRGAIEVAISPDDRYVFVSMEDSESLAVFNLHKALTQGFSRSDFVGSVPLGIAPVGIAVSPGGKLIYATSEAARGPGRPTRPRGVEGLIGAAGSLNGTLTVINLRKAETKPAQAVVATIQAECSPVRVITSADGHVVWVTARGSDAVLGFSAAKLLHDPGQPDDKWGERVCAVVQLQPGHQVNGDELTAFVKQRLGSVKAPKQVEIWPAPP